MNSVANGHHLSDTGRHRQALLNFFGQILGGQKGASLSLMPWHALYFILLSGRGLPGICPFVNSSGERACPFATLEMTDEPARGFFCLKKNFLY